ncbi:MAG: hypothetical protein IKD68_04405, partial [Solobacterium sp.]|nr:hypothetical protein [Solobacterium sp.]
ADAAVWFHNASSYSHRIIFHRMAWIRPFSFGQYSAMNISGLPCMRWQMTWTQIIPVYSAGSEKKSMFNQSACTNHSHAWRKARLFEGIMAGFIITDNLQTLFSGSTGRFFLPVHNRCLSCGADPSLSA